MSSGSATATVMVAMAGASTRGSASRHTVGTRIRARTWPRRSSPSATRPPVSTPATAPAPITTISEVAMGLLSP
jgi:hypothetical protein